VKVQGNEIGGGQVRRSQPMEDFDDPDESEIDGENRPHDKVNQIPNSKVNRN